MVSNNYVGRMRMLTRKIVIFHLELLHDYYHIGQSHGRSDNDTKFNRLATHIALEEITCNAPNQKTPLSSHFFLVLMCNRLITGSGMHRIKISRATSLATSTM